MVSQGGLPIEPGSKPIVVRLIRGIFSVSLLSFFRQEGVGPWPIFGPPGLESFGGCGLIVGLKNVCSGNKLRDKLPGTVFPQSQISEMFP